ncbi:MAG: class I SAM-dependent rRNA methyltransferase [Anaerolineae bacterium]|nr:class I SAM-dependent rRNA methyltransferase [Anaerolineae bacterium]NUQ02248.1 class I SAM-dependent rRNA methyltransferase [Anaerolineae bacterium]
MIPADKPTGAVVIAPGREKPIQHRHPWIFSGAITELRGNPAPGDVVDVQTQSGRFLARGYWNPRSQIQVRILTWREEPIDEAWWRLRLQRAVQARQLLTVRGGLPMSRLVHAESDFLPGLIVDHYGEWLVLQALTLGIDRRKAMLATLLADLTQARGVYERSDVDVRGKEGLRDSVGGLLGEEPPEKIQLTGDKQVRLIDLRKGHKTGYYLDQIPNQGLLADLLNGGIGSDTPRLLNLFSYTGGFGLSNPGAVVNVDASREALELAEETYRLNGFDEAHAEFIQGDVFDFIRDQAAERELYDVVVCDPPKFAHNAGQVDKAARGYKDLNLHSFKLVRPGGFLLTFSCSGAISRDLFQKIVFGALADSGRDAQILRHLAAGEDHPVALTFPEGEYLKGFLLRVY